MTTVDRRRFLTGSLAATAGMAGVTSLTARADEAQPEADGRDFYEVRTYRCGDAEKQAAVLAYVEAALQPALGRLGCGPVGVMTPVEEGDSDVYVLVTYPSLELIAGRNAALEADETYQQASASFFDTPTKEPRYSRIESRLMHAFAGMPRIAPPDSDSATRLLELRIYESHNEMMARRKVEMFNEGEIDIMKDVGLGPVFFGETLFSGDVPNLTYMLSGDGPDEHATHWKGFGGHPEWQRMKGLERYKGTVSKITSVKLRPTKASGV